MKKPSPAIIIATVALFASVSGASYATTQIPTQQQLPSNVPNKSVGTPQLKGKAVTQKKIAKKAIGKGKIKPNAVRTGKINDQAVTKDKIAPGVLPTYSTDVIYASVEGNGSVRENGAAGLTQQNIAKQATGVYCIVDPPVSASAQATLNGAAAGMITVELAPTAIPEGCSAATKAVVRTFSAEKAPGDLPFSVQLTG